MAKLYEFFPPKKTCANCGNYMCIDLCIHRERYIYNCLSSGRRLWCWKDDYTDALYHAPPRVRHLALHGKKRKTRKKNINRARKLQRRANR